MRYPTVPIAIYRNNRLMTDVPEIAIQSSFREKYDGNTIVFGLVINNIRYEIGWHYFSVVYIVSEQSLNAHICRTTQGLP